MIKVAKVTKQDWGGGRDDLSGKPYLNDKDDLCEITRLTWVNRVNMVTCVTVVT